MYKDCTVLLLTCMNMGDPHHDKNLKSHKGSHPNTMKDVARNMDEAELRGFAAAFRSWLYRAD
eukprot:5582561-Karenia_brevis.AAC.1